MVLFTKDKMPWCLCPFKNEAYRPGFVNLFVVRADCLSTNTIKAEWVFKLPVLFCIKLSLLRTIFKVVLITVTGL